MNTNTQHTHNTILLYSSLLNAINKSGGDIKIINQKITENNMTLSELLDICARNNIRFQYQEEFKSKYYDNPLNKNKILPL